MEADGETTRVAGLAAMPLCTVPSFQRTFHGDAPVSAAWIVVDRPAQIGVLPLTVAVGTAVTGIVTDPLLLQPFSVTVTSSWSGEAVPAAKAMEFVPAPDVIVPFVIVRCTSRPFPRWAPRPNGRPRSGRGRPGPRLSRRGSDSR